MKDNFKYVFKGEEVSKEQFEILTKDAFKWFSDNSINAVDYSSVSNFFGENYKSKGEINNHLKGVLEGGKFPFDSTQQNNFVNIPFGNNGAGGLKVFFNKELDTRLDNLQDKFKKAVGNCVSDGDFSKKEKTTAYKETEGKLFYELDWGFITQMAERMASNKKESKYDLWNWKKPMTPKGIEDLKQATLRHLLAVLDGVYEDDGRKFGHLEAISDNMMMINYQLKNNSK